MTTQLAPAPVFKAFDNNGNPLINGQLLTLAAGTTNPQATYIDSTQITQNTNPVILNSRGEANVWLDPTLSYKFQLSDSLGNPIWTIDNINGPIGPNKSVIPTADNTYYLGSPAFAWANVYVGPNGYPVLDLSGNIGYWQKTAAETTANVTPLNLAYPPGHVDRYAVNATPGTTDMTVAFQAAINQARVGGNDIVWGDTGLYLLGTGPLDCTFTGSASQYGLTFRQIRSPSVNLPPNTAGGILCTHSSYAVFDLTGCNHFTFYDLSLVTTSSNAPSTCFLTARNSTGESNLPRFYNTTVAGYFTVSVLYNYGSEDGMYVGNFWGNYSNSNGANCIVITANNYYKGASNFFTSAFTTIATGAQSCIGHTFFGGDYAVNNTTTASDVFYLEGAVADLHLYGLWMNNSGGVNGRSYIYNDTTNGAATLTTLHGVKTEVSATVPTYGIYFGPSAASAINWSIRDSYFTTNTYAIASAAGMTAISFALENIQEAATKGLNWNGTVQDSFIQWQSNIVIPTSTRNVIIGALANITITTNNATSIVDQTTGSIYAKGSLGMAGATGASKLTGWGTPTAGSVVNNFPGSGATLAQCGSVLTEIIAQLQSLGLLGS